jgi:hypothetical protein
MRAFAALNYGATAQRGFTAWIHPNRKDPTINGGIAVSSSPLDPNEMPSPVEKNAIE